MAAPRLSLTLLGLVAACASAGTAPAVAIRNQLAACVSIADQELPLDGKIPVVSMDLRVDRPIGECGCKSAWAIFSVASIADGHRSPMMDGRLPLLRSGTRSLPLAVEPSQVEGKHLEVTLACAPPD